MTTLTVLAMGAQPEGGGGNPLVGFIPILLVMVIFYMLILRPQQRRHKEHQTMLGELKKGDRVLTNGGLFATIQDVKDDFFVCTIAEGVKVEIARNAVSTRVQAKKK
jgi:preprotein translocase subunit YajC